MTQIFSQFNLRESLSAFLILLAIIDAVGAAPIILDLRKKGKTVSPLKATLCTFLLLLTFFFGGDAVLTFFSININSFAVAGSIILMLMSLEMLLDIEIFHYNGPSSEATFIPIVFPMLAGAGSLTSIIALKADYADINILTGLTLNMIWVFLVLILTDKIQKKLGDQFMYMIRKFFGVMLLAIAVGMFTSNIAVLGHGAIQ